MLTVTDVLDLIDHLVETHGPDHRPAPRYVSTDFSQPECIAGKALHLAGVPLKTLVGFGSARIEYIQDFGIEVSLGAKAVLRAAQNAQDESFCDHHPQPWGEAQRAAHKAAERFVDLIPSSLLTPVPQGELVGV